MVVMATHSKQLMSEVCHDIKRETSPSLWNLDMFSSGTKQTLNIARVIQPQGMRQETIHLGRSPGTG